MKIKIKLLYCKNSVFAIGQSCLCNITQTFWYQTFENFTKIELSGYYSINYPCKCKSTFAPSTPPPTTILYNTNKNFRLLF